VNDIRVRSFLITDIRKKRICCQLTKSDHKCVPNEKVMALLSYYKDSYFPIAAQGMESTETAAYSYWPIKDGLGGGSTWIIKPESSPLVTRRYFVTCKSHLTSGGRDRERHFLLGGRQFGCGKYETSMKHLTTHHYTLVDHPPICLQTNPNSDECVDCRVTCLACH
jgi:hypothetical protein